MPQQLPAPQQPAVTRAIMQQRAAAYSEETAQLQHKLAQLGQRKTEIKSCMRDTLSAHAVQLPSEAVDSYKRSLEEVGMLAALWLLTSWRGAVCWWALDAELLLLLLGMGHEDVAEPKLTPEG